MKWGHRITGHQVFELKRAESKPKTKIEVYVSAISALGKLREEECKFKASLGYTVKPCLTNINKRREVYAGRGTGRWGSREWCEG